MTRWRFGLSKPADCFECNSSADGRSQMIRRSFVRIDCLENSIKSKLSDFFAGDGQSHDRLPNSPNCSYRFPGFGYRKGLAKPHKLTVSQAERGFRSPTRLGGF